jgi:hypothetical protein
MTEFSTVRAYTPGWIPASDRNSIQPTILTRQWQSPLDPRSCGSPTADQLGRKAVTIVGIGRFSHPAILAQATLASQTCLTCRCLAHQRVSTDTPDGDWINNEGEYGVVWLPPQADADNQVTCDMTYGEKVQSGRIPGRRAGSGHDHIREHRSRHASSDPGACA